MNFISSILISGIVSFTDQSGCEPGWHLVGASCFKVNIDSRAFWQDARIDCSKQGGDLMVPDKISTLVSLTEILNKFHFPRGSILIGSKSSPGPWRWINGSIITGDQLWGYSEPSGDGKCINLRRSQSFDPGWKVLGWRWNDDNCNLHLGRICQRPKGN